MKKLLIVAGLCLTSFITVLLVFNNTAKAKDPRGELFAGATACVSCHKNIYDSYLHTAHYLASIPATEATVHGTFTKGLNQFEVNDHQKVVMEKFDSGLFQTYYLNGKVKEKYRFDIVFGGVKGESYLGWNGNKLYQLPLSYFSSQRQWSTSPGYGFNFLDYPNLRNIRKRCLECHASYIGSAEAEPQLTTDEQFNKSTLVYGIDCERCHGPAQQHVEYQTQNPLITTAKFITSYTSLSRSQKVDMCAVCHSGNPRVMLKSTFGFRPGDAYEKFKIREFYQTVDTAHLDVHGNQVQLLESSKCFINSGMDCATCHDTHRNMKGNDESIIQKCLGCHNNTNHANCKMTDELTAGFLKTNCINCHMPAQTSKAISVQVSDKMPSVQFSVHTHHIAIYPQEIKKILAYINK